MGGVLPCCRAVDRSGRILFLGPRQSGKTSALYCLKTGSPVTTVPTHGYNRERLMCGKHEYDVYEIGGAVSERQDYLFLIGTVSAVIYFIDHAAGEKGLNQALKRLEIMLGESALASCPVAVVANKQDLCEAPCNTLMLTQLLSQKMFMTCRKWKVFPCTGRTGQGIDSVLKWTDANVGKSVKVKSLEKRVRHGSQ